MRLEWNNISMMRMKADQKQRPHTSSDVIGDFFFSARLFSSFSVLGALLAIGMISGACSGGGGAKVPCDFDRQCDSHELCIHGFCEAIECRSDMGCTGTLICEDGFCARPHCSSDADCGGLQICEFSRCVEVECLDDGDCDKAYHCDNYTCIEDECVSDGDCGAYEICDDGFCVPEFECIEDDDCDTDFVCEDGVCIASCHTAFDCPAGHGCKDGHCLETCDNDDSCEDPHTICEEGICVPVECMSNDDCDGELIRCNDGRCETYTPCDTIADCEEHHLCVDGICEELPRCDIDSDCSELCIENPCVCKDHHCYEIIPCEVEADCADYQDCIGGTCVDHYCRGHANCETGMFCIDGFCVSGGDPGSVSRVVVLTPGGPIVPGQHVELKALAFDSSNRSVPGVQFDWFSTHPTRIWVSTDDVAACGGEYGSSLVTARVQGGVTMSQSVEFSCVSRPSAGTLRAVVVDSSTREPVEGALVVLEYGQNHEESETDAAGMATFTDPEQAVDVHVFDPDYDYLSVLETTSTDLLMPVSPRSRREQEAGVTGKMMEFPGEGNASFGLCGISLTINLVKMNFVHLMGEFFNVTVNLGQVTKVDMPAMVVVYYSYMGIPLTIKPTFYSLGEEGYRTAWGFGGKMDSSAVTDLFGVNETDWILSRLFPYFSIFEHALKPIVEVESYPRVADVDDINGNGNTEEMRPDWASFENVEMTPSRKMVMSTLVLAPDVPEWSGEPIATAIYIMGVMTPWGLTPLGMYGTATEEGEVPPTVVKSAPAYGGLESGTYTVAVFAVPPGLTNDLPDDMAMVLSRAETLPRQVSFSEDFLAFPEDAEYDEAGRTMTASHIYNAILYLASVGGPQGMWEVYLPGGGGGVNFTFPEVPDGMDDLATGGDIITLGPITLNDEMEYEELMTFDGQDLDRLNSLIAACTRYQL